MSEPTSRKEQLTAIRTRLSRAPANWAAAYAGDDCLLQAANPDTGEQETFATLRAADYDAVDLLSHAHADITFLLSLLDEAFTKIRQLTSRGATGQSTGGETTKAEPPKNYTANCAMLCKEPAFKKFLKERHGLGAASDEATAAKVREMLGVASRNQINTDTAKADIWVRLAREFEQWKRGR